MVHFLDDNLCIDNSILKNNEGEESIAVSYKKDCQIQHTVRHRAADVLPTLENSADDLDNLDDVCGSLLLSEQFLILGSVFEKKL